MVRRLGRELGRAGVDGLVDRPHPQLVAGLTDVRLGQASDLGHLGVREPVPLGESQGVGVELRSVADGGRDLVDEEQLVDEPRVDLGGVEDLLGRRARADRLHDLLQATVVRDPRLVEQRRLLSRVPDQVNGALLFSSERSALLSASVKLRPIAIASPTDFMCVVSVGSAVGNFSNAKRGTFTTT